MGGRRFFTKENNNKRSHHVHIFQAGANQIVKHLVFRDYLIDNQTEAERYKKLKSSLYQNGFVNVELYQEHKAFLINELTENALKWTNKNK